MAATLASVCSVPLTSVLLLFELTKDYTILLPLMVIFLILLVRVFRLASVYSMKVAKCQVYCNHKQFSYVCITLLISLKNQYR